MWVIAPAAVGSDGYSIRIRETIGLPSACTATGRFAPSRVAVVVTSPAQPASTNE